MNTKEEQIREDSNELLNTAVAYAKRMLRRFGEFGPFGFKMNDDGDTTMETVAQQDMPPDAGMLLDLLRQQLTERGQKKQIVAAAMASNVTMSKPSEEGHADAVMIEIEHQSGYCVKVFVPYRITGGQFRGFFPRVVKFGAIRTQEGVAQLFTR